jgi:hypothetical protein
VKKMVETKRKEGEEREREGKEERETTELAKQGEQAPLRSLFIVSVMFAPQCLLACPFDAVPEGLVIGDAGKRVRVKRTVICDCLSALGGCVNYANVSHNTFVQ